MALTLKSDQKVGLSVVALDASGNVASLDGAPVWEVGGVNPEVVTLVVSEDGLNCQVVTVGPLGLAQVSVTADADLGEGVRSIAGLLDVEVVAAEAVSLAINAGVPELR